MPGKDKTEYFDPRMGQQRAETKLRWLDADTVPLIIEGLAFHQIGDVPRRMPESSDLPPAVNHLASHTAGAMIRFCSSSTRIALRVKLYNTSHMCHMPWTGSCGFDLYGGIPGEKQYFLGCAMSDFDADTFEAELCKPLKEKWRDFTINFPLYSGVEKIQIGIDENAGLRNCESAWHDPRRIVIYGSSITQGGCASRPGMAYPAILGRKLNMPVLNFGFSGNGKGEPAVAEMLAAVEDPALYILDYEPNAGYEGICNTLDNVLNIIRRKHHEIPIIVMSQLRFNEEFCHIDDPDEVIGALARSRKFQQDIVEHRRASGDDAIYFVNGGDLLGSDWHEFSVDGCHQTDLGFYRIAAALEAEVRKILKK